MAWPGGRGWLLGGSGPVVADLFHRLLALVSGAAWLSLLVQIRVLVGERGLLPVAELMAGEGARRSFLELPTIFHLIAPTDGALVAVSWLGILLSGLALAGVAPRVALPASALLYLSHATACRDFLWFQWDNMLVECGVLAAFLPRDRAAPWIHVLFRLLLFKLYFESGIAKWQSHLRDWHDGSAMTYYYETAPIPTPLAYVAHRLPDWWHHVESRATLVLELGVPLLIFGPRRARLVAAALLSGFQLADLATANYGFFCWLSLFLGVFLLDDRDVLRARDGLGRALRRALRRPAAARPAAARPAAAPPASPASPASPPRWLARSRLAAAIAVAALWSGISLAEAVWTFARQVKPPEALASARRVWRAWRVANTYHLFGHITRERIEPEFQTFDGAAWTAHDLYWKPGDPRRAPPFVAPHQPRVDFRLWFYGLSYRHGMPPYVRRLLDRMCHDPSAVASLFVGGLPPGPRAVKIVFWRYRFADGGGPDWWRRERVEETRPITCR